MFKAKQKAVKVLIALLLLFFAVLCLYPFLYMLLMSFTTSRSLRLSLDSLSFDFANYLAVFEQVDFFNAFKNSLIITAASCLLNDLVSAMAAYGFAKKRFRGSRLIFTIFMLTMMVPGQSFVIPVFVIMRQLDWVSTYQALILVNTGAFGVFLIRSFMGGVPDELLESAKIDGCGETRIFVSIVLPLIRPALVALTIFTFINTWNDFLWPLVVALDSEMYTLQVVLASLKRAYVANYGLIMAGATLSFLFPFVLYLFLQKLFIEGIAISGIKG